MRRLLILFAALLAAPVAAQNSLPGLENFTLERPQPTPTVTPTATPSPIPIPAPPAASPSSTPSPSVSPATVTPRPRATATAPTVTAPPTTAPPALAPAPAAVAPEPSAVPPISPPAPEVAPATQLASDPAGANWPVWAGIGLLVLAALGILLWWRARGRDAPFEPVEAASAIAEPPAAAPPPTPALPEVPPLPPSAPAKPGGLVTSSLKPTIGVELLPQRAGVDTLRATVEYEVQIANTGRSAAHEVTVHSWLLSAGHELVADLARLFGARAGEPMLPPFDLPAGGVIDLNGLGNAPRDTLATITAGERRSFVPVLAVRIGYRDGRGTPNVMTAAFLIGLARAGQELLAPLPLDRGSRMHDQLAVRRYEG